jgi:hypothetical protein
MSRLSVFIFGILVGGALIYGALTHYLLHTSSGWELVPKTSATFDDSYLDVRAFTVAEWAEHRELVGAIVAAKKEHILGKAAQDGIEQGVTQLLDEFRK